MSIATAPDDPIATLHAWIEQARAAGEPLPEAMTLATATAEGVPSARIVLLRGRNDDGVLRWFTNERSRKGRELHGNPRAALLFHWKTLERQVRVEGAVHRLPAEESDAYFAGRPRGSQLSATVSPQSEVIENLEALHERRRALSGELGDGVVPRPEHWGGFGLVPQVVELWRSGVDRLHERWRYARSGEAWQVDALAP